MIKKLLFLTLALGLLSVAAMAQDKVNYSGTWILDREKSYTSPGQVASQMTLVVTHIGDELKIVTNFESLPFGDKMRPATHVESFVLDGKEVKTEADAASGRKPVTRKGWMDAEGTLNLLVINRANARDGSNTMVDIYNTQTWRLSVDGKTLSMSRQALAFGDHFIANLFFIKK